MAVAAVAREPYHMVNSGNPVAILRGQWFRDPGFRLALSSPIRNYTLVGASHNATEARGAR